MNSLVGLGATASFAVSCVAAALPALRWKTFFEEPAMLLGGSRHAARLLSNQAISGVVSSLTPRKIHPICSVQLPVLRWEAMMATGCTGMQSASACPTVPPPAWVECRHMPRSCLVGMLNMLSSADRGCWCCC